jgi:hypothetical protein
MVVFFTDIPRLDAAADRRLQGSSSREIIWYGFQPTLQKLLVQIQIGIQRLLSPTAESKKASNRRRVSMETEWIIGTAVTSHKAILP